MQLKSPEIFELGDTPRNWRHKLENPLTATCLLANTEFDLFEISSTGFCVQLSPEDAPEELELALTLPDCGSILNARAKIVRVDDRQAAYSMELAKDLRERLRRFLFNRHRSEFQSAASR
nr:PilZ domain-containing protein [Marinifaba aquimaris]